MLETFNQLKETFSMPYTLETIHVEDLSTSFPIVSDYWIKNQSINTHKHVHVYTVDSDKYM